MPRDLSIYDNNELIIRDPITREEVAFYYRTPTTADRVGYQKALVVREGNKIYMRIPEAQLKYGAAVLTGIRPGDFVVDKAPLSSTPGEVGYREDWKALVEATAGDLLMVLGREIFEGSALSNGPTPEFALTEEEDGEAAVPLAKSSPECASVAPPSAAKSASPAAESTSTKSAKSARTAK